MPAKSYRYSFLALLIILFWAPLPFASNVLWAEMMLCVLVFILTLAVLIKQTYRTLKNTEQVQTLTHKARWALCALALAQVYVLFQLLPSTFNLEFYTGSIDPNSTAVMLLSGIALCCTFYLVLTIVDSEKRVNALLLTLIFSGVLQASYGSVMTLSGIEYSFFLEKLSYRGVATGTFINRNHLAGYLVLTLACGIGLMVAGFSRHQFKSIRDFIRSFITAIVTGKGALRISLVIMVIGLVLTRSRMGNTSFFIGLTLAGIAILISAGVSKKTISTFLVSILLIDALIISSFFDLDQLAQRLETTSAETENRDEVFKLSLPLIRDNLWFGTGAGSFYTAYPEYRDNTVGSGFFVHAHNDYVEFLSERGILGVLPLLGFFVICMHQAYYLLKSRSMRKKAMAFTILMTGIAISLHSTVDFNLQMPAYALTLVAVWALGFSRPYIRKPKTRR